MKKLFCSIAAAGLLVCGLAACQTAAKDAFAQDAAAKEDAVTIQLVCESEDVYQIYYTAYLAGKESGMGGWADVDGGVLTPESDLSAVLTKDLLGEGDVSTLSMDFSPYGKGGHRGACHHRAGGHPRGIRGKLYHCLFRG